MGSELGCPTKSGDHKGQGLEHRAGSSTVAFPFKEGKMTVAELHRLFLDTQDHMEHFADMWFSYLKFSVPCLICYVLGWMVSEVSHSRLAGR